MGKLIAIKNTVIKSHPIDSSSADRPLNFIAMDLKAGESISYEWIKNKGKHYLFKANQPIQGRFNWYAYKPHFDGSGIIFPVVRKDQAEAVFGRSISDFQFRKLDDCLKRFDIDTIPRVRHFLSQVAHESGGLRWLVELADGRAYEGRRDLGNIYPGDGPRFKGVDPLQMTGRANYQAFSDFIGDARVMEGWRYVSQTYLFQPSGFWWYRNKMNALIDGGATVRQVTRRVNGGFNGLADRERYYQRALTAI